MKTVILAGGFGTRLSEYTETIPKPMVPIGGKPILWHIMRTFADHGYSEFLVALGYKAEVIKDYFLNYRSRNDDFEINLGTGNLRSFNRGTVDWKVTLLQTGLETMTGVRLKRLKDFIGKETFLMTYGDGVADININALVDFHRGHGKMVTISAVRPSARFGELQLDGDRVSKFAEKPRTDSGWINGGYFVIEPKLLDLIDSDKTVLEREPLEMVANDGELMAFRHDGFWQCMDTKRDVETLENMWEEGNPPWAQLI